MIGDVNLKNAWLDIADRGIISSEFSQAHITRAEAVNWGFRPEIYFDISYLVVPKGVSGYQINESRLDLLESLKTHGRLIKLFSSDTGMTDPRVTLLSKRNPEWTEHIPYAAEVSLEIRNLRYTMKEMAELAFVNGAAERLGISEHTHVTVSGVPPQP